MNARWYDSSIGRFISADTIVPDPTNPQSFNRYSYVRNNPVKLTDPTGHCANDDSVCLEIAQFLSDQYDYSYEELALLDWSLGALYSSESGGNEIVGYSLVEMDGQKVLSEGYDVYSINFGTETDQYQALVAARSDTGTKLTDFKNNADKYEDALFDQNLGVAELTAGATSFGAGVVTTAIGFIPEPVSPVIIGLGVIEIAAGGASVILGAVDMWDANNDMRSYYSNAESAFLSLIDYSTPYAVYTLAVDLDGN